MALRGAISGFGDVASQAHLPGWNTREGIKIVAVHDPVPERRHEAIRLIKNVRVYEDLELMLDGEALDFVDIASPPAYHVSSARLALTAGAHVLVEKPLCLSLAEFEDLANLATATNRILMCVHNWKYAPAYALARQMIADGRIGAIQSLSLSRLRTEPAGAGRAGGAWRASSESGGGILIDHGWHVFYLMEWLMGGDPPSSVAAQVTDTTKSGAEDGAEIEVGFARDRIATAHLSWRAPQRRTLATVRGENGNLDIDGDCVVHTDPGGHAEVITVKDVPDDSYHAAWFAGVAADFEESTVFGSLSPRALRNLAEARVAIALIAGVRKSAQEGGIKVNIQV